MSRSSSNLPARTGGDFILYTAPDGAVKVDVFFKNETVWLTQKALAEFNSCPAWIGCGLAKV